MPDTPTVADAGHGHVRPRPDGLKARCGGPAICPACKREKGELPGRPHVPGGGVVTIGGRPQL